MIIKCPNGCENAKLIEVLTNCVVSREIKSIATVGGKGWNVIENQLGHTYHVCSECNNYFGKLTFQEMRDLKLDE